MFKTDETLLVHVSGPTAAGTTTINSASVDMQQNGGFDGVLWFTNLGTPDATNNIRLQDCQDNATWNDVAGSKVISGTVGPLFDDLLRPALRYNRLTITRAVSTTIGDVWALLYRGRTPPYASINNLAGTQLGNQLLGPADGTA